jgi:hypothetical protein
LQDFSYGFKAGTADNGNLASMTGTGAQLFNRSYSYDSLNRLSTMVDSASGQSCKGLQESYDAWGNRTSQSVTSGSCFTFSAAPTTKNQLTGYAYDAAGNMIADASHRYYYDAENRMIQIDGTLGTCLTATACYIYDAQGQRVQTIKGTTTIDSLRDFSANVIADYGLDL